MLVKKSLNELILNNKEVLRKELQKVMKPLFKGLDKPSLYREEIEKIYREAKRLPFPRQARAAIAANEALKKQKALILSAEMGTGKTAMSLYLSLLGGYKNNVILCPPHLVSKWAEEVHKTFKNKAKVILIKRWEDLIPYKNRVLKEKSFFIISREAAKLSYKKEEACVLKQMSFQKEANGEIVNTIGWAKTCPDCGQVLDESQEKYFTKKLPYKCPSCKTVLRQPSKEGSKKMQTRLSIAEYVKSIKFNIDLLIVDEVHEYKGGNTGQGLALSQFASVAKKIVGLTGTLLNGYASSLFYILYRLNPSLMKEKLGFEYKEVNRFIETYGAYEEYRQPSSDDEGVYVRKGKKMGIKKEKPKISPHLLSLLLEMVIFLRLDEIKIGNDKTLPLYEEVIELVEFNKENIVHQNILESYNKYINRLVETIVKNKDRRLLGNLANDSLSILDMPHCEAISKDNSISYIPPYCSKEEIGLLPKEEKLISLVKEELKQGRKCLVYIHFSNKGVGDDVEALLKEEFPHKNIGFLKPNIPAAKREQWIKDNPADILICNPELVKTGLDLLEYPTIIFYETTYNVYTLKQASRRSWRLGQRSDVKVIFMAYANTPQNTALRLIAAKVNAANSLEGRLSDGNDLASESDEEENIQMALAKALLNGTKVEEQEEISTAKVENFGVREWDRFEEYYLSLKPKEEKIIEEEIEEIEEEIEEIETSIETEPQQKQNPLFDIEENGKITVYITNKGKVEKIEASKEEIEKFISEEESDDLMLETDLF